MSEVRDSAGPASGQISCSMPSVLLRRVRMSHGDDAVVELLRLAGVDYTPAYLDNVGNWIWYREAIALFEAAAELTGDDEIGRRVGEETVRQHAGTAVATLFRSLGSPEAVYERLAETVTRFSTVTSLTPTEVEPGRAVISARARDGFRRHRHLCDWTGGMLSTPPELFGLPPATVEESLCEVRGDEECRYTITWDAEAAATDSRELVTALEAQLAAMTQRLESMYATARDLIALDDVDAALARITERAATAVRAPKYLLAVRTGDRHDLHVHHRGFVDEDPEAAARALLDDAYDGQESARLVAEVGSATRHYGRLMAASPAGAFLPHERDLLGVYARYAASVLDTATALDDSRRRGDEARALLELSRALASAPTSDEVAHRLADAVPAIVDCDRVVVFLWDEAEGALTRRAVHYVDEEPSRLLLDLQIKPSQTASLARLLDDPDPRPLFFEPDTDDAFVAGMMRELGSRAIVVVPIVARERLYGILTVAVRERAERLSPTPPLLDCLAGVVAQSSTALENASLIETMAHQASHDSLTGLFGHRAFHERLQLLLGEDGRDATFTLATIDIDDFKAINDEHGHPVGDEALRLVAETLRANVRGDDTVFRVGGEEFAVLLPGLTASAALPVAERLRLAIARTPFVVSLRASIGLASWPCDASDRDELLERADAALYAAKRAGKDRTLIAGG